MRIFGASTSKSLSPFTHEHFGWWSCHLNSYSDNEVDRIGTFKINQPGEWPKDIRLPDELLVIFHDIWILSDSELMIFLKICDTF